MFDVVIIGAGPVGLYTAKLCEDMGYKIAVLEDDKEVGKPVRCSGLISRNIERFFPDIGEWDVIENEIDFAVMHSKRGEMVLRKPGAAYVINREKFDKKLSKMVGPSIKFNCRVRDVLVKDGGVDVLTGRGIIRGEMAIGCDGPCSVAGKGFAGANEMVRGLIGIVKKTDSSNNVDMYFDKTLLKDGFFWKIPRGKTTEYGVWGSDVKFADIEKFFGISGYEKFAGMIPVKPVKKSYSATTLLVGDAAGQVKPWSGGGVVYGLTCSRIAAKTIEKAFRFNDFSEAVLKEYENEWKKSIGKQLKFGRVFRRLLKLSSDFQLDVMMRTGKIFPQKKLDMDFIL